MPGPPRRDSRRRCPPQPAGRAAPLQARTSDLPAPGSPPPPEPSSRPPAAASTRPVPLRKYDRSGTVPPDMDGPLPVGMLDRLTAKECEGPMAPGEGAEAGAPESEAVEAEPGPDCEKLAAEEDTAAGGCSDTSKRPCGRGGFNE
jgi:hypothetical protein